MKKFILLLTFIFCAFFSFAQSDSCSYNNVYVNDIFYKARNGEIYDTGTVFITLKIDTTYVPIGTYFYRFSAKGYTGETEHHGVIEVIR